LVFFENKILNDAGYLIKCHHQWLKRTDALKLKIKKSEAATLLMTKEKMSND